MLDNAIATDRWSCARKDFLKFKAVILNNFLLVFVFFVLFLLIRTIIFTEKRVLTFAILTKIEQTLDGFCQNGRALNIFHSISLFASQYSRFPLADFLFWSLLDNSFVRRFRCVLQIFVLLLLSTLLYEFLLKPDSEARLFNLHIRNVNISNCLFNIFWFFKLIELVDKMGLIWLLHHFLIIVLFWIHIWNLKKN